MPKRASTPASRPEASAIGMRSITRANRPVMPDSAMSRPQATKAPIASGSVTPVAAAPVASTAAPGVDHAVSTGCRQRSDKTMLVSPMPRHRAHSQEVVCAGVAPSADAAWNTSATELVKPTSAATKPATIAERERSFSNCASMQGQRRAAPKRPRTPAAGWHRYSWAGGCHMATLAPSSTTRLAGRLRKSAAAAALRCMLEYSFSRQLAMPLPSVGMTISRDRK